MITLACFGLMIWGCTPDGTADAAGPTYDEQHRPQLHFSPPTKWMNDPNGMVFYEGEYHLFYQYYPDSTVWGPMHWGHAISKDLVHWEQLPIALYPDKQGYIFSGSAVVDWENTSGFGKDIEPPLVAIFTYHDPEGEKQNTNTFQSQAIAYSNDKGRTWTKYADNPVIPNPGIRDFRDPKVIWDGDSQQWVMVLAAQNQVKIYGSPDLKNWKHLSDFGSHWGTHAGVWECPDLFPVIIPESGIKKWVLLSSINPGGPNGGSATQYFIGDFNGKVFQLDQELAPHLRKKGDEENGIWLDYGRDNYAGVTWSNIDEADGRRIFLGWMSNWDYATLVPTKIWRSAMTLPRVLEVHVTPKGPRIFQSFADELQLLRGELIKPSLTIPDSTFTQVLDGVSPQQLELILEAAVNDHSKGIFGFVLTNTQGESYRIGYDVARGMYFSDRTQAGKKAFAEKFAKDIHYAPKQMEGALVTMHIIFDHASVELIADDGMTSLTDIFFPTEDFTSIAIFVEGQPIHIQTLEAYPLSGIWK